MNDIDNTAARAVAGDNPGLRIGTAPDSWGVWFPDDPNQVPWRRFLDEVVESGYEWIDSGVLATGACSPTKRYSTTLPSRQISWRSVTP